ncbi:TIGR00730 family Rossman fold protein [Chitinophagaceae bacterium LWZ2-11]
MYKSIAVFCGSRAGNDPLFVQHAKDLGKLLAANNVRLIYGGGNVGLMGAVASSVMDNGGNVIGVIPEILVTKEQQHTGLTELRVVEDMHIRKRMMYELCDAAIVLPGGHGTLDELYEMLTWNILKIHEKKIILLNTAGFYTHLIGHMEMMQQQGFLYDGWRERLDVYSTPQAIFNAFQDKK